ncbi:hypothetical protein ADK67_35240 [Saccharothrix sp. NRRL B-16348]|uniref:hypothetical protein n=1 Tax=Saccharothrix sp. NRRL B-16348 TaxID=1415542 RepID=UPI0006AFC382|nr:hypothetical protein [Saccharothrix sp. NRRL B-16348]KOX18799.1 hypothetical protein ADK67_35240 [Saccharothrix sp. NRRL B-16348]
MDPREDDDDEDDFDPEEDEDGFDDDDVEDEDDLFGVTSEPRTICHLCGGAGFIANPTSAVIGGAPRTVDNGRECPHCVGARKFPGLIPPL